LAYVALLRSRPWQIVVALWMCCVCCLRCVGIMHPTAAPVCAAARRTVAYMAQQCSDLLAVPPLGGLAVG
jgi:hypothetical protein